MKKLVLLLCAFNISLFAYSQNINHSTSLKFKPASAKMKAVKARTVTADNIPFQTQASSYAPAFESKMFSTSNFSETRIGITRYDLQSNRSTPKLISNNGDGTLSAVWTFVPDGGMSNPDRGTGYNYFNGISWGAIPIARIENKRTGNTNIAVSQAGEFIGAHQTSGYINLSHRATKGVGAWSEDTVGTPYLYPGQIDVWSRLALSGPGGNIVHVITNSGGGGTILGQMEPMTYSRSLNGGATWVDDHIQIPGTDSTFMYGVGAEEYHIDARNNVVAVVVGGFTNDVALLKSLDNGNTWTRTVIFPYNPGQQGDTIDTNSGDVTVTIDNNNLCHVAFSHLHVLVDTVNGPSYFPYDTTGLYYWNENMNSTQTVAYAEDFNGNGMVDIPSGGMGLYNVGMIGQPSIGIDSSNTINIAYSAIDERADTLQTHEARRHVFIISSSTNGTTWSTPYTINPSPYGDFAEAVWPSVATLVDNNIHVLYQRDSFPGSSLYPNSNMNNSLYPSDIIYAKVVSLNIGINENESNVSTATVYPNPNNGSFTINLNSQQNNVDVKICNMYGQIISQQHFKSALTLYEKIDRAKGLYFVKVRSEKENVVLRVVKE